MVITVIVLELFFVLLILCLLCRAPYGAFVNRPFMAAGRRSEWREAQHRAETLLREVLGEEDFRTMQRRGFIDIPSPSRDKRVYRVPRHQGQVKVYEGGVPIMALCVQSIEPIPDADTVLMHKLMIEGNESEYLRTANRFEPTLYGFIAIRPRART